jgi:D-3-phosphoglycerate dehydrogenase
VGGYANHSVSDHALALMFACSRALFPGRDRLDSGFGAPPHAGLFELHDKTLGIVGLGRIGGALCRKAQCLFERILASDPYIPKARFELLDAIPAPLEQLLEQSHVISLHCPLTPETRGLIGAAAFERMARRPILLNTARGAVIDEIALLNALQRDLIRGAGLDVYEQEPVTAQQKPILDHPRTVCTGHYAWYSDRAIAELQRRAALNMLALLRGEIPDDCLNP